MGRLFGTDGVRGIANSNLSCELAMKLGRAAAMVLTTNARRRPLFVIGMDTRISSEMLSSAITAGLCSVGADVIILGVVPTPAVAYLIGKYKADAGVMISASHNSAEYNGIKMFSGDGYKLPDVLEEEIESIVIDNSKEFKPVEGADVGKVTYATNAVKYYIEHLKNTVPNSLEGIKIAVDCANGSASATAKLLLEQLGAEATVLYDNPDGININENCGSTHLENLSKYVVENKMDIGIAFDGDADRCLCVDENGEVIDGDQIIAMCALDMKERGKLAKSTAIGTILTNLGFVKFCEANDINFIATKVGDRYVLEEMLLEEYNFGGEQSGHIIFRDYATTGDGELTAIQVLSLMKRTGKKVSELAKVMNKYPQVSINVIVSQEGKVQFYTNPMVKEAIDEAKEKLKDLGRIIVRPSGTEPKIRVMVECFDEELMNNTANKVAEIIREELSNL
ncbi:MAG: phosphoglucosamine mutase [Clostridia bacterium]|nr:phosphoglucosamine mutase [Clostridia bacterium]